MKRALRIAGSMIVLVVFILSVSMATGVPPKVFGVVGNPSSVMNWAETIGVKPTMPMQFEAWSNDRTLDVEFAEARLDGFSSYMITWEPWQPVAANLGVKAQAAPQPLYSNASIADGLHDAYIKAFAESVADSGLQTVYIRFAQEMNGNWYPWSINSKEYILAWRHIVHIFRASGATNARFIYSTNPSLYQTNAQWTAGFWKYWPGSAYVDYVGSTMINFGSIRCRQIPCSGSDKGYPVSLFEPRVMMGYELTGKQTFISEFNTSQQTSLAWLTDFDNWLATGTSWISGVVLSQEPSRASEHMPTGNLDWSVLSYPDTYSIVRNIVYTAIGN